ncbi:type I restriction enzyme HsdR N-terminal domain-containing protein [Gracilimonas sediminicola]|uniref:Type I restriction enzyme HsdR N-terminal domain-containing protein n=1 Tax=Gracilimonas sediminicola TaxID=2952158 RepID=A0A9X2L251_9BACT|nr:type I restriction enzyme HsdR N-terminal domain-containing protein [Gracilimonas sediminicola]MCP9290948.1 type I restriction enzyme HsdR N-terminal domain-containing protein [Gracilimonas sediminicola]
MLSKALSHFPQFRFRDGEKRLWNPILKKTFVIRPEEQIRLALVDYLILEAGVSSSRISFESPVKLPGDKSSSRTDIICYDSDFKPLLLVECKAPDIKLDEKAAIQVARYNQKVGAPYLLVSNGTLDYWFEVEGEEVKFLPDLPELFHSTKKVSRDLAYWTERGFIGEKLNQEAASFALESCMQLYKEPHQPVKYLGFDDFPPEFALAHYYRIFGFKENRKVGLCLSANLNGETRLNTVLNVNGANTAFCTVSLNALAENENRAAEVHSGKGVHKLNLAEEMKFGFGKKIGDLSDGFHEVLSRYS